MKRFTVYLFYVFIEGSLSQYRVQENKIYAPEYNNYRPQNYEFEYGISNPHTGDHKSQWEKKENGVVFGVYSLLDPDGFMRIVEYTADSVNGFRAIVKRLPIGGHHENVVPLPQAYGFNAKQSGNNYAPYSQYSTSNLQPAPHTEKESEEDDGSSNTEKENVETHENDEVEENEEQDHDNYEAGDQEEEKYSNSLPYHAVDDEEDHD
ncbi:hypothetical protein PPYR_06078 [Photinus pyralis]|uniref:Cuticle protein 7 n=1 Tax=Photinus pyralis TaxID=7054 RepID=A0A5N4ASY9_PHOPY|nr:uncharacterized protein LOC116167278 [Photinus pyralis]KAB0800338.1 hypothetical protein PPYR_06078 [Photinus pyralis]